MFALIRNWQYSLQLPAKVRMDLVMRLLAPRQAEMAGSRLRSRIAMIDSLALARGVIARRRRVRAVLGVMGLHLGYIRTALAGSRYEDELLDGASTLNYDYAPPSREYENDGLKRLTANHTPVILLKQVKPKPRPEYMVVAPMYVDGFDDQRRQFALSTRADSVVRPASGGELVLREIRRAYGETTVRTRLHQAYFRRDVLTVYRGRCSVCELRTRPLLQGAHIVPDAAAEGIATVQNGLALCSLHHAAYDRDIVRISPDYEIHVEQSWIAHGDQFAINSIAAFHGRRLVLPRDVAHRPNRDFLARRFER